MIRKECPSYPVSIFIAGYNVPKAEDVCAAYCDEVGFCVTVTLTEYVYTGGKEFGLIIGLINYPRFPATPEAIWAHAEQLAERLRTALKQDSYSIQAPDKTVWISHRAQGIEAFGGDAVAAPSRSDESPTPKGGCAPTQSGV